MSITAAEMSWDDIKALVAPRVRIVVASLR